MIQNHIKKGFFFFALVHISSSTSQTDQKRYTLSFSKHMGKCMHARSHTYTHSRMDKKFQHIFGTLQKPEAVKAQVSAEVKSNEKQRNPLLQKPGKA